MNNALAFVEEQISSLMEKIDNWEMIKEAVAEEKSPHRNRMVVQIAGEYYATYRWEINYRNGYLTVQLRDGSILPTAMGKWCPYYYAEDFFQIPRNSIIIDDPEKG